MENKPEASEVLCLPHGIIIMTQIKFDDSFTKRDFDPFKTSSKFTKHYACHAKLPPKPPLMLTHACQQRPKSATPATRMKKCPMSCT
jgi:hypothetical protein